MQPGRTRAARRRRCQPVRRRRSVLAKPTRRQSGRGRRQRTDRMNARDSLDLDCSCSLADYAAEDRLRPCSTHNQSTHGWLNRSRSRTAEVVVPTRRSCCRTRTIASSRRLPSTGRFPHGLLHTSRLDDVEERARSHHIGRRFVVVQGDRRHRELTAEYFEKAVDSAERR